MAYPSLGREIVLLQRYLSSLPEGLVKCSLFDGEGVLAVTGGDDMRNFEVTIAPRFGPYEAMGGASFSIHIYTGYFLNVGIRPVGSRFRHPNLSFYIFSDDLEVYSRRVTLALLVEYLVHFMHYPDFASSCHDGPFTDDETVHAFLRESYFKSGSTPPEHYPYFTDEYLQRPYWPTLDYVVCSLHVELLVKEKNQVLLGDWRLQWRYWTVTQAMQLPWSGGREHQQQEHVYFERAMRRFALGHVTSLITQHSFAWNGTTTPLGEDDATKLLSVRNVACLREPTYKEASGQDAVFRDLAGAPIPSHDICDRTGGLLLSAVEFEWENRSLEGLFQSAGYLKSVRSSWPFSLAPGSHLAAEAINLMQCQDGVSNCKRASSCILFRDIMKSIKGRSNLQLILIDPMTLSLVEPLLCGVEVNGAGDLTGLGWQCCRGLLCGGGGSGVVRSLSGRPWLLLAASLLSVATNVLRLTSHVEIYSQLGQSRPALDVSLPPHSVIQAASTHRCCMAALSNSTPLLDTLPLSGCTLLLRCTATVLFHASLRLRGAQTEGKLNSSISHMLLIRPFTDLYEI